jgi:DNA (cytosine-5)-methyltransferase 1
MTAYKVGGQCEGYAGIFLALQQLLPVEHAWYAEVGEAPSKVLARHFPGTPNHGDITVCDWATAEPVEIFTSGFPCTDFSLNGLREGSLGKHHLWPTGVLPAVTALRPPLAIFENVKDLLSSEGGRVFGAVLADLNRLGYRVSWTTVGACRVGACHHRHRIFIAATAADVDPPDGALFGLPLAAAGKWPPAGFLRDGLVWEMPAEVCVGTDAPLLPTPKATDGERGDCPGERARRSPSLVSVAPMLQVDWRRPRTAWSRRLHAAVESHESTFGRRAPEPTTPGPNGGRPLSARFAEWMMALPEGWMSDVVGRDDGVRMAGNGVLPAQAAYALSTLPTFRAAVAELGQLERVSA